jgi:hypothetical protein
MGEPSCWPEFNFAPKGLANLTSMVPNRYLIFFALTNPGFFYVSPSKISPSEISVASFSDW